MPECTTQGCHLPAVWEIEIRLSGANSALYYACDEHCRRWMVLLSPVDEIRRVLGGSDLWMGKQTNCPGEVLLWPNPGRYRRSIEHQSRDRW